MSKLINGFFGLAAAAVAFGAVQFASGSDLQGPPDQVDRISYQISENNVNRDAKGDRAVVIRGSLAGHTLSFQTQGVTGASILMRLPAITAPVETARNTPAPAAAKPAGRQAMIACEPVVSVLTTVAKQLPPGRCLT